MTSSSLNIFIVNDNIIFATSLLDVISNYPNLKIVAEVNNANVVISTLEELFKKDVEVDLVILQSADETAGSNIYRELRDLYPDLPIFILSGKEAKLERLIPVLANVTADNTQQKSLVSSRSSGKSWGKILFKKTLQANGRSGLQQIKINLARVDRKLNRLETNLELSNKIQKKDLKLLLDLLFWKGRKRELLAAKLLIKKITSPSSIADEIKQELQTPANNTELQPLTFSEEKKKDSAIAPLEFTGEIADRELFEARILEKISTRIKTNIENSTDILLEIDILRNEKKLRLFEIVFETFQENLTNLNQIIHKQPEKKQKKRKSELEKKEELLSPFDKIALEIDNVLITIWRKSTEEFLLECLSASERENFQQYQSVVTEEEENIRNEILNKIPLITEAFAFLLLKKPLILEKKNKDSEGNETEHIETEKSVEIVIQNTIVKIANAVTAVFLNNFVRVECIEENVYKRSLISSREMAKIRNNLSWRYRREKYIEEPKNIFESQYRLFYFNGNKIYTGCFYNPRTEELNQLRGIPWLTTIGLETRDALAPLLQAIVEFLGEAIFYLLKDVIGRGIGLIGQGIIQGIGNALQDNRYSKNNKGTK